MPVARMSCEQRPMWNICACQIEPRTISLVAEPLLWSPLLMPLKPMQTKEMVKKW